MKTKKSSTEQHEYPPVILTLWQDAWVAISQPSKAIRWALQPIKRSLMYLALLSGIIALIATAYGFITLRPALFSFAEWIERTLPEVTIQENTLQIANDETIGFTDSDQIFFKFDTTQSKEDNPQIDSFYEIGVLITSDQLILKDAADTSEVIDLAELGLEDGVFSGVTISQFITGSLLRWMYLAIPLLVFLFVFLTKSLYTLFFSVLLYLFSGMKYNLVQLWSIGIYSLTPSLLAGYISFVFGPFLGLSTLVFLLYFFQGFGAYIRFQHMKPKA